MIKKAVSIILSGILCLSMASCAAPGNNPAESSAADSSEKTAAENGSADIAVAGSSGEIAAENSSGEIAMAGSSAEIERPKTDDHEKSGLSFSFGRIFYITSSDKPSFHLFLPCYSTVTPTTLVPISSEEIVR